MSRFQTPGVSGSIPTRHVSKMSKISKKSRFLLNQASIRFQIKLVFLYMSCNAQSHTIEKSQHYILSMSAFQRRSFNYIKLAPNQSKRRNLLYHYATKTLEYNLMNLTK